MPVLHIPTFITKLLNEYASIIRKRFFKRFCLYVFMLIVLDGPISIRRMSKACGFSHHSHLTRLLSGWRRQEAFMDLRQKWILHRVRSCPEGYRVYLVIDDTALEKRGKKMEGTGWHYSEKAKRAVWAHNFVGFLLVITTREGELLLRCPLALQMYRKKSECKTLNIPFLSKIDQAQAFIKDFEDSVGTRPVVLFDAWYCAKKLINEVQGKGYDYVSRIKSNRNVYFHDHKTKLTALAKSVMKSRKGFSRTLVKDKGHTYETWRLEVDIPDIGLVLLIISKEQGKRNPAFFITNRLTWTARKVIVTYGRRWTVEEFFKEVKQLFGLEDYHVRAAAPIQIHVELVLTAFMILERIRTERMLPGTTMPETVDWVKTMFFRETMRAAYEKGRKGEKLKFVS